MAVLFFSLNIMWLDNISFPFGGEQMNCLVMWDGRSREKESHSLLQAVSDPAIAHPLLCQVYTTGKAATSNANPGVGDYEVAFQTMLADTQSSARTMRPKLVGEIGLQHQRTNNSGHALERSFTFILHLFRGVWNGGARCSRIFQIMGVYGSTPMEPLHPSFAANFKCNNEKFP
ncbi:hypothetical protein Patl1_34595 [Pistacia atlantica]|uniref:Uncharacterized protein n=1 Tax=Pistacia atlantica TaxID=434234 RepID=A0ACC0ZVR0_9ROSI|nr:hypothetical protein Patl1_34595 [Pistacia atlantica]